MWGEPKAFPFWQAPPLGMPSDRTALLITYHFPPGQAAGALRWQQLTRFGGIRNWCYDIVTTAPSDLQNPDWRRVSLLPAGTRLFGALQDATTLETLLDLPLAAWRPIRRLASTLTPPVPHGKSPAQIPTSFRRDTLRFHPASLSSWRRAWGALVDYARGWTWASQALAIGRSVLTSGNHNIIISCGPPHLAHEVARRLSRRYRLPFVIDLRDPWSLNQRTPESDASPLWFRIAAYYEAQCVRDAALIVMNTEPARDAMRALYPRQSDKIITISNGFDDTEPPPTPIKERFTIAYAGSVYLDRTPRALFEAVRRVVNVLDVSPEVFTIEFMGDLSSIDGASVQDIARDMNILEYLRLHPRGTLAQVEAFLTTASVLVSLPQDSDLAVPSKIFEYMRYPAWILALADSESATAKIFHGTDAHVVHPSDVDQLTEVLLTRFSNFRSGISPKPLNQCRWLSREFQAGRLYDELERIVGQPTKPAGNAR